ncbi:MAG: fibro-slime domain-containing protein [Phycisphaerales bacterium]
MRGLRAAVVLAGVLAPALASPGGPAPDDRYAHFPSSLTVSGVRRDFRPLGQSGGHPDMELAPPSGPGIYAGIVRDFLGQDGKPVFAGTGWKVTTQAIDGAGRPWIGPKPYITGRTGDSMPVKDAVQGRAVTSSARFAQWFRDVNGVNTSRALSIRLERQPGTNRYLHEGALDGRAAATSDIRTIRGGAGARERHAVFTCECEMSFTYRSGKGQYFTLGGDDDLWAFIDGRLVVDLGGIHGATWQYVDLDRLHWLRDGAEHTLKVFYAERQGPASHFRMETNLMMRAMQLPPTSGLAD